MPLLVGGTVNYRRPRPWTALLQSTSSSTLPNRRPVPDSVLLSFIRPRPRTSNQRDGSVLVIAQLNSETLTLARTGGGRIPPPSVFFSIAPEPLKIFTWGKNLFLEHPVPHKMQQTRRQYLIPRDRKWNSTRPGVGRKMRAIPQ